jgi:hypothetical protein
MPELRLRSIHLPELHLPEMSREEIGRVIGDARRDADLGRFDPRRVDLPEIDLSNVDIPKAVATAAQAAGIVRSTRRPRLPFVIGGLITLALVGFALMTSPLVRPRLTALGQKVKERIDERRAAGAIEAGPDEAYAFDAAVAVPIEPSAFSTMAPDEGSPFDGSSDLPDGLGADAAHAEEPIRS